MSEVRASIGPKMRSGPMNTFNQRPAPYDHRDRFGGMNRFNNNPRNPRNNRGRLKNKLMIYDNTTICYKLFYTVDFDNGPWGHSNNFGSRGSNMRGNMDMKGANYRANGDNWNGNSGGIHCIHMRGLPFRATEQDIADVSLLGRLTMIVIIN